MKLSVSKRNQQIQKIDLTGEVLDFDYSETVFLIGRSKDCHIVLDDKQISREHTKLIHRNGHWKVELIANESLPLIVNGEEVIGKDIQVGDEVYDIDLDNAIMEAHNKVLEEIKRLKRTKGFSSAMIYEIYWTSDDTLQEVADKIGISKSTVFTHLKRVRQHLKSVIQNPFH